MPPSHPEALSILFSIPYADPKPQVRKEEECKDPKPTPYQP